MSRICQLTGKRAGSGNTVSHSNRRVVRSFQPNLVVTRINGQRVKVAASTLRTIKKWTREAEAKMVAAAEKKAA